MRRAHPRLLRRTAALVAGLAAMATIFVAGTPPAHALTFETCATHGAAYLTTGSGRVLVSGLNGDQRWGIPTFFVRQGDQFRLGGNGIQPAEAGVASAPTRITFSSFTTDSSFQFPTGEINFIPNVRDYQTQPTRENCVVHEEGPFRVTAPPGSYRITATYLAAESLFEGAAEPVTVVDQVVNIQVLPGSTSVQEVGSQSSTTSMVQPVLPEGGGDPSPGCEPRRPCPL